jgi:hypothetical protein
VISGSLAQKPLQGGHTWVLLQYLLGFRLLGWDVTFIDELAADMCFDEAGDPCAFEDSVNWRVYRNVLEDFGLLDDACLILDGGKRFVGITEQDLLDKVRNSALLLNIMGYLGHEDILAQASRRVFLDIDPGFGQMWADLGLVNLFEGHDDFITIGERIGTPGCPIPTCGLDWITTPQPIVLEHWPACYSANPDGFSSVVSWRGAYGPISYKGEQFGLRAHEFRKFFELPFRTKRPFQLALNIHTADSKDLGLLHANRWDIVDPQHAVSDWRSYRRFIQESSAEFLVAKNMYVKTNSGWFSDRSICYLASGKPVLAQDTGLEGLYPSNEGLLLFRTIDEAVAQVEDLEARYDDHCRAARELAETRFDSNRVLSNILGRLGLD